MSQFDDDHWMGPCWDDADDDYGGRRGCEDGSCCRVGDRLSPRHEPAGLIGVVIWEGPSKKRGEHRVGLRFGPPGSPVDFYFCDELGPPRPGRPGDEDEDDDD